MPRPRKCRKVCCLPENDEFGPLNGVMASIDPIVMTVDEYETIRLIDLEGLMQEACAERMQVARTTVQRIYMDARKKLAMALVNGNRLVIKGGDYTLCDACDLGCGCEKCHKKRLTPLL